MIVCERDCKRDWGWDIRRGDCEDEIEMAYRENEETPIEILAERLQQRKAFERDKRR